jgi:hypothetical protein
MNLCRLIGRLLAVIAIAGLVAAPLATPGAAKRLAAAAAMDMPAMSGDMPCCPTLLADGMNCCSEKQKSNDCQDCPLMAMCTLTIAQAEPPFASGLAAPLSTRHVFIARDDLRTDGLVGSPPDHPPRTLV